MRKKWTYVAIFSMMLGMAPVFTGCIDTDEPAGLEDLRVAKAELLRAKAQLELVRQQEVLANAELIKAQAEMERARARNERALAAINEARAKQEEAIATLKELDNEQKRAEIAELLKQYQRDQLEWELEYAQSQQDAINAQKSWELAYQQSLINYEKALVELKSLQATLASAQQTTLNQYIDDYKLAMKSYREAADKVTEKLRAWNDAVANQDVDDEFVQRELNWDLIEATKYKEGTVEALARAEEELNEAKELDDAESTYKTKQKVLQEEIAALNQKIIDLTVEAAEKARTIYETDGQAVIDMEESKEDYLAIKKTSQSFELDIPGNIFPWYTYNMESPIVIEGKEYTIADAIDAKFGVTSNNFAIAMGEIERRLEEFKSWQRDENDDEWTKETISRLEYTAEQAAAEIQIKKDQLDQALNAYSIGDYPTVDPTAFFGYPELSEAVTSFNAQVTAYNNAAQAIAVSEKAIQTAQNTTLQADYKAADDARTAAYGAAAAAHKTAIEALPAQRQEALDAYMEMQDQLRVLQGLPASEEVQEQIDALNEQIADQYQWITELNDGTEEARIDRARATAEREADAAWTKAYQAADEKMQATVDAEEAKIEQNETARDAAEKQLKEVEYPATLKAFQTYRKSATDADLPVITEGGKEILDFAEGTIYDYAYINEVKDGVSLKRALVLSDMTDLDREALLGLIIARSKYLYGDGVDPSTNNVYGDLTAQIAKMTADDLKKKVQEYAAENEWTGLAYFDIYDRYGKLGEQAKAEEMATMATAWLSNKEEVQALVDPLQKAYDAMLLEMEEYEDELETRQKAIDAKKLEVDELLAETFQPAREEEARLRPIQDVLNAVNSALAQMIANASDGKIQGVYDTEWYVKHCQEIYDIQYENDYIAETNRQKAEKALAEWNSDKIEWVTICKNAYDDAYQDYVEAGEDKNLAYNRLLALLEQLGLDEGMISTEDPSASEGVTE